MLVQQGQLGQAVPQVRQGRRERMAQQGRLAQRVPMAPLDRLGPRGQPERQGQQVRPEIPAQAVRLGLLAILALQVRLEQIQQFRDRQVRRDRPAEAEVLFLFTMKARFLLLG